MDKLKTLKDSLKQKGFDYTLIPMRDEFGCEYVPPQGRRIEFLTGFTGSNAFVIIGKEKNMFFTDGRYTLQAKNQLDSQYEILEMPTTDQYKWLADNIKAKEKISFNPKLFSVEDIEKIKKITDEKGAELIATELDLIDEIWHNKPAPTQSQAFKIDNRNNLQKIYDSLKEDILLETNPENIAWLLNLRGKDLAYTPVILSFLIIDKDGRYLFFSDNKSTEKLGINTKKLDELEPYLKIIESKQIQLDAKNCPYFFYDILKENNEIIKKESPIIIKRAIKNDTEINNIKNAHKVDGLALCRFFIWLEKELKNNKIYSEFELSEQLSEFRKKNDSFYSLSFDVIMGFKNNGAIIHYRPEKETSKKVGGEGMLLIDSGAQYFGDNIVGTTDVTRTIYIGSPEPEHKKNNTLVLKGHIAIASAKIKKGENGKILDSLARNALKAEGLDYKHGTGHGVGYFLNVHEGPHGINSINEVTLQEGMIISNEPGYYKEGEYGIRVESLVCVKKSQDKGFLEFETLTLAPIDLNLIDCDMLTKQEKDWLNYYHKQVFEQLSEFMNDSEKDWLKNKTREI